jgi:hypothetical protein
MAMQCGLPSKPERKAPPRSGRTGFTVTAEEEENERAI